jgi:hypothetical protein
VDSANGRVKLPKLGWTGATIPLHDPVTGEIWPASLFVIVLGTSSCTYAEATWPPARFCEPHDLSLSEIVSRAVHAALPQRRRHG